MNAIK